MKKIIASAVGLMIAGGIATTATAAVENQFGGYWRTRMVYQDQFAQADDDTFITDNRTRLYYTAKFSDDFKFVNKFEFNTTWGDNVGGDIGADGMGIWRIKNSYADWNMGPVNAKLGIQAAVIARGFIFDDDFSGAVGTIKAGNVSIIPLYVASKTIDGGKQDFDESILGVMVSAKISDAVKVTPYYIYHDGSAEMVNVVKKNVAVALNESTKDVTTGQKLAGDISHSYVGVDADLKFGDVSAWFTGIYNFGTIQDVDINAFLVAAGVDAGIAHGQAFYATGDDGGDATETNKFVSAPGSYYAWAEIMGEGIFDNKVSAGTFGTDISDAMAFNAGVTIKPVDKLTINADVWYAALAEDNANGDTELGIELDGKIGYKIFDNLTAEYIFAYLISGDATGDEDVIETGARFSLSF